MGFNTASIWIKVALVALALGSLLFTIGYATVAWMTYTDAHVDDDFGLWRHSLCNQHVCTDARLTAANLRQRGWTATNFNCKFPIPLLFLKKMFHRRSDLVHNIYFPSNTGFSLDVVILSMFNLQCIQSTVNVYSTTY
ncbi:hypothetical protein ACJMK2_037318 [Sinanodonta woodiana]|uniref:Uncharacterized protein n=1 Tax=Sinanodonta woodiana TaxID=1069815 RepID=A0ABD3WJW8_SINWO